MQANPWGRQSLPPSVVHRKLVLKPLVVVQLAQPDVARDAYIARHTLSHVVGSHLAACLRVILLTAEVVSLVYMGSVAFSTLLLSIAAGVNGSASGTRFVSTTGGLLPT